MSDTLNLDELERLAEAATRRPWEVEDHSGMDKEFYILGPDGITIDNDDVSGEQQDADAAYIVAACNSLPSLLARVRELEAQVSRSQEENTALVGRRRELEAERNGHALVSGEQLQLLNRGRKYCIVCKTAATDSLGHAVDCWLADAMKEANHAEKDGVR